MLYKTWEQKWVLHCMNTASSFIEGITLEQASSG